MSPFELFHIAGGVALILFSVRFIRKGLDRLFGPRLGVILQRLAGDRIRAFFAGLTVSVITPSSTTVSMLSVQMLDSGHLTPREMLAVMFGANIGLTALVLLGTLDVQAWAPLLLCAGVVLFQFTRRDVLRGIGQIALALGFIFLALGLIRSGATIAPDGDAARLLGILEQHPLPMAVAAAALALLVQSSTATILLVAGLSAAGLLGGPVLLAVIAGANLGVALTTLLLGWRSLPARRLAVGNLLVKAAVAGGLLLTLAPAAEALAATGWSTPFQIGVAHTGFNIVVAMVGMPLIPLIDRLVQRLLPSSAASTAFGPKYLGGEPSDSVALSLGQSMREILRVSELVRRMLEDTWRALRHHDEQLAKAAASRDDEVDLLDAAIKRYLTRLAADGIEGDAAGEQMRQLRFLAELETIGDVIDKNLSELVVKKIRHRICFSREGEGELNTFYRQVRDNMMIAEVAFQSANRELAEKLLRHKEKLNIEYRRLRDQHLARLNAGLMQSHQSSAIHLDLLTHLKRINSCVSHIAYAIVDPEPPMTAAADRPSEPSVEMAPEPHARTE